MTDHTKALADALKALLKRDERNTCQHQETHRGGAIWTICDDCGAKWADDRGGKPEWQDPPEWIAARKAFAAYRAASTQQADPCWTDEQIAQCRQEGKVLLEKLKARTEAPSLTVGDDALPPLPATDYKLFYEDEGDEDHGDEGYQEVLDEPGYTAKEMRAYARAAIEQMLARSGQYVTNDASREAAIAEAVRAAQAPAAEERR